MGNNPLLKALGAGSVMQTLMVVIGHYLPAAQAGLFPVGGTLIGLVTGWLAGKGLPGAALGKLATHGGIAGAGAGIIGSLISTALGDVPMSNAAIAGGSTLVSGAIGGIINHFLGKKST